MKFWDWVYLINSVSVTTAAIVVTVVGCVVAYDWWINR